MWPNNFSESEFKCKGRACCNGSAPMDSYFLSQLQRLREKVNKPITITSGYRCNHHNASVKGSKKSFHTLGRASDIKVIGLDVDQLANYAKEFFKGVIIYKTWVHVDTREIEYYADKR